MKATEPKYWFPAKKYGWGWGPPCAWQGWVVLFCFIALLALSGILLLPGKHIILFFLGEGILITALIITCFLKGEPPRWRWGKD